MVAAAFPEILEDTVGLLSGQLYALLPHHLGHQGIDLSRLQSGALRLEAVTRELAQTFLGNLAARAVVHADEQDLLFEAEKNDLEMFRVVVTYGNGVDDTIQVRHLFREGSRSRLIDLPGGKRIIRKIVFFYKTVGPAREGRALVKVYGL